MNNFLKFVTVNCKTVHGMLPFYSQFRSSHVHFGIADHRKIRNIKTEKFPVV
jgi:hypothetical protein